MSHGDDEWGSGPPYGAYRGRYSSYEQAQFASVGSGLLGGWSCAGDGMSLDDPSPDEADAREELRKATHGAGQPHWASDGSAGGPSGGT
jgi:hypothetical protein